MRRSPQTDVRKRTRTSPLRILLAAPAAFTRSFLLKAGFRDGLAGLCIARFAATTLSQARSALGNAKRKDGGREAQVRPRRLAGRGNPASLLAFEGRFPGATHRLDAQAGGWK